MYLKWQVIKKLFFTIAYKIPDNAPLFHRYIAPGLVNKVKRIAVPTSEQVDIIR